MESDEDIEIFELKKQPLAVKSILPIINPPSGYHWYGCLPDVLPNGRVTQALRPPRPQIQTENGKVKPEPRADYYNSFYYMLNDREWQCLVPNCKTPIWL